MNAQVNVSANVQVTVQDANTGEVLSQQEHKNLVVSGGLNLIRDLLDGDTVAGLTHFAVGTGTGAVSAIQTTLGTEVFRDTVTQRTSNTQQLIVSYYLASGSANGNTLSEAGLFNASTAGTMFARVLLNPAVVKTSAVAVTLNWTINLGAA
jgi:hypothetical protein